MLQLYLHFLKTSSKAIEKKEKNRGWEKISPFGVHEVTNSSELPWSCWNSVIITEILIEGRSGPVYVLREEAFLNNLNSIPKCKKNLGIICQTVWKIFLKDFLRPFFHNPHWVAYSSWESEDSAAEILQLETSVISYL